MKVILSVPDEGYSRNASCTLNLIPFFFFIVMRFECKLSRGV